MKLKLDWKGTGLEDFARKCGGMAARLSNMAPAFKEMGRIARNAFALNFATEGEYSGARWKPLNPRYAAWKLRKAGYVPILWLTGEMYRSFTQVGHPMNIEIIGPRGAYFGSAMPRAIKHDVTGVGRKKIRRPITRMTTAEKEQMVDVLLTYLIGKGKD